MKKSLLLAFMLMIAANLFAQQQMATLNHNDTITVFYGNYALRDAHNAAVNGDIITLSSGSFNACDITKVITIHGAGWYADSVAMTRPSIVTGNFKINNSLRVEGVYFNDDISNYDDAKFIQCYIDYLRIYNNDKNIDLTGCLIKKIYDNNCSPYINCMNTVIRYACTNGANIILYNSLFIIDELHNNVSAFNSVIGRYNINSNIKLSGNSVAYNCIFVQNGIADVMYTSNTNTNKAVINYMDIYEYFHSNNLNQFSIDERYILKEEIATSFLGSDGTQVGIHGGMFPFDTRPSYMVVKKCNVANKSTIDGKLSVDIEVMVEE